MLPATFQTPAAIVLLGGGLLACFAGYRVFRVVLVIAGFVLGTLLASSFMGTEQTAWMIAVWLGAGVAGALILLVAYFAGVALMGAAVATMAAHAIWASFAAEPAIWIVILFSIAGALGALVLQRYVIIVSTSFFGAQSAVIGAAALLGETAAAGAATRAVFSVYPLDPVPNSAWDTAIAAALGIVGLIVQLAVTARKKN